MIETSLESTRTAVELAFADVLCNVIEFIGKMWAANEPTRVIEQGLQPIKDTIFNAFAPLFEVLAENV